MINRTLLGVAVAAALAAAALTFYVVGHPVNPDDITVERDVQATAWGPLALTFPIFSWIGDAKGLGLEVLIFIGVLIFNRRTWLIPAVAAPTGGWYLLLSHLIIRPRPTTAQVLQVTEHPGASSFPSGHTMFIVTVVTVLMLCFGYRFLRGWGRAAGWVVAGMIVVANGIGRINSGAHWPSDVVAGLLIAVAWLALVVSLRWINSRVLPETRLATRRT